MSEQTPPYPYYNGIIYNSKLFSSATGDYLPRSGVATSVASSTTFNGIVYTSGLTNTGTLSTTNLSVSGTVSLPSASIADSALSTNQATLSGTQTFSGAKTFSVAPVMSVDNIYGTIPDGSLSTNVALLPVTQTFSGAKTFSVAPVMSGASITATSIPDTALSSNQATLSGTQTFSGAKTFSLAPTMSGSNISGTIPDGSLSTNVALLNGSQTFTGIPKAPTASVGTNTTQIATTAFVLANSSSSSLLSSNNTFTGTNTFSVAPVMSGASITATSIPDTALSTNVALLTGTQTFSGAKTFSVAPVMSGASISATSIPDTALSTNQATLSGTQTFSGAKTFSLAPTMSGSNITGTIPDGSLSTNVALLTGTQTFSGAKTFSLAPTMSGSNITGTIPDGSLSTNVALLTGTQTFSGAKTFSSLLTANSLITTSQTLLSYSANTTLTAPFYQTYMLNPSGSALTTDITLTIGTSAIPDGTVINFRKYANTTANILLVMTGRSFVPYNSTSGIGTVLLTANQQATSIVINGSNAYQTYIGGSEIRDIVITNGINDKTSITSGGTLSQGGIYQISNSISTYFSGSYTSYTLNPFTGSPSNVNYSYLVVSSSNTITYTGLVPITIYYLCVGGGGGGGGNGGVLTSYSNASGCGGGGGGQVVTGSFTLNTSDTITITIGTGGTGGSGAPSNSSTNGSTGNTGVSSVIVKSGTTIATALGGSGGVGGYYVPNSTTAGNGGDGGAGGGGTPAGGAGGTPSLVGNGNVGASNASAGSGSGGSDGQGFGTFQNSGSAITVMQDNYTISGVSVGGFGGYWSGGPNNSPANGYGGGGGGAKGTYSVGVPINGANGNSGVVMLYFFNLPNFQVSNNAITQIVPTTMSYNSLPTLTNNQIGYSVPITVNTSGSNVANQYYLLATITNMPIGVFIIFYTLYIGGGGAGFKIGLSTSSTTATNSYLNFTDLIAIGMSSYYYVFSNTSVRTIYIMGYSTVVLTFQTNYGGNSASCVRIA